MKHVIRLRFVLLTAWLTAAVLLAVFMPDVEKLVREKGQPHIPDSYSSARAERLLAELNGTSSDSGRMDVVVVFHEDQPLTSEQQTSIRQALIRLQSGADTLGILQLVNPFANEALRSELIAADGKTVMAPLSVQTNGRSVAQVRDDLHATLQQDPAAVHSYLTGSKLISADQILNSQAGVHKTEKVTVLFIIVILVVIFRSPITPLVSLITVGISYFISLGIVTQLVDKFDFPFASTTQTFLILVLFGIGCDYTILLFARFKEELGKQPDSKGAMLATYRTAGTTVLYSGAAVLIGFGILGFARFSIYRSSVAVAVGVLVLLLCLYTLLPLAMVTFGRKLFWPMRGRTGHGDHKLWSRLGQISLTKPIRAIFVVLALIVPFACLDAGQLSYNSMAESSQTAESVQGVRFLSESFTPGKALPTTIVVSAEVGRFDTGEGLAWIDGLTEAVRRVPGVQSVTGPTRPKGEKMEGFYVEKQAGKLVQAMPQAPDYWKGLAQAQEPRLFYMPTAALQGDYEKAIDTFMAKDRRSFKLSIVLSPDPYSNEAMDVVDRIDRVLDYEQSLSPVASPTVAIGGVSSVNRDLSDMAQRDFSRTVWLMLVGIMVMLVLITRAFWLPIYMIGALVLAYYAALRVVGLTVVPGLGMDGLSWTVPFFSFIMVVALGVDYSIFFMMRYRENAHRPHKEAVLGAMKHIGGVILSAAVILSGTFAAMIPSGVPSLIEIACVVIVALALLCLLLLPVLVPALMTVQAKLNAHSSNPR
ncbi:MAG: hypothetical protein K0R28_2498 [Paenibacillus sp.]|jgi:uncharacterized membrane protein YdfJ with MMPL/SSD domain|nr:hypothetical protein [Paenibacillus sp.]